MKGNSHFAANRSTSPFSFFQRRTGCGECIETALGPQKLLAGGRYSVDVLATALSFTVCVACVAREPRSLSRVIKPVRNEPSGREGA